MYARGQGVVLNEPSVVAINTNTNQLLAVGHKARRMLGRTPGYIVARRPLRKGAITDFEVTQDMIRILLRQVGVSRINRARVVVCVPSAITPVERRAVMEAARRAGAIEVRLIDQPLAAAIGAGLPIDEPVGSMVVDIGGGTTETALLSLGGVVALEAVRVGSFDIDDAIQATCGASTAWPSAAHRGARQDRGRIGRGDPQRDGRGDPRSGVDVGHAGRPSSSRPTRSAKRSRSPWAPWSTRC